MNESILLLNIVDKTVSGGHVLTTASDIWEVNKGVVVRVSRLWRKLAALGQARRSTRGGPPVSTNQGEPEDVFGSGRWPIDAADGRPGPRLPASGTAPGHGAAATNRPRLESHAAANPGCRFGTIRS